MGADAERLDGLAQLVDLLSTERNLYVRYGESPGSETRGSIDYESGLGMPGLSANRLQPQPWWTRPLEDWLARQICQYVHLIDRSPEHQGWIVRGTVIGQGPDDEPLLADVEVVARVSQRLLDEARHVYQVRFDPGRISH